MVKYKDTVSRVTPGSRNITIDEVHVVDGRLFDESGDIIPALVEALPDAEAQFTIKIKIELPDEEQECL